jgi:hypothetical protein
LFVRFVWFVVKRGMMQTGNEEGRRKRESNRVGVFVKLLEERWSAPVLGKEGWKRFLFRALALLALYAAIFAVLAGLQFSVQAEKEEAQGGSGHGECVERDY